MSPGHSEEIASVFLWGAGCACSGSYNTILKSENLPWWCRSSWPYWKFPWQLQRPDWSQWMITTRHAVMFQIASASSAEPGNCFPDLQRCEVCSDFCQSGLIHLLVQGAWRKWLWLLLNWSSSGLLSIACHRPGTAGWGTKTSARERTDPRKSRQSSRRGFVEFELIIKANCRSD